MILVLDIKYHLLFANPAYIEMLQSSKPYPRLQPKVSTGIVSQKNAGLESDLNYSR